MQRAPGWDHVAGRAESVSTAISRGADVTETTDEATGRAGDETGLRGFMNQGGFWRDLPFLVGSA